MNRNKLLKLTSQLNYLQKMKDNIATSSINNDTYGAGEKTSLFIPGRIRIEINNKKITLKMLKSLNIIITSEIKELEDQIKQVVNEDNI